MQRALAGVSVGKSSAIRSGDFEAGGHTWALSCRFGTQGLASISLQLVSGVPVTVKASLRIDDPLRRWPAAAVWRSDDAKAFPALGFTSEGWIWELRVPDAFRDHEERYLQDDDRLSILCVVVPPPTLSRDLHRLLFPHKSKSESASESVQRRLRPDVTFIVEEIEIQAHKLLLAMQSPVLAAEFRWNKDESSEIRVHDMSATTFRAMLRFIYTGELPIQPRRKGSTLADKEKCTSSRSFVAMALDLLVAADRRQQLEDSCIDYIASHPDAYTAMKATEDYKELKESCCSFLLDITDKLAMNMSRKLRSFPSSSGSLQPSSTVVHHGAHAFTIPNFRAVQRSLGRGDNEICSGTFQIGGYDWILLARISNPLSSQDEQEDEEPITVYLQLFSDLRTAVITASMSFKVEYPSAAPPIRQKDSLIINCELTITEQAYAEIGMPPSNIASLLEHLLMSEQGSDVRFLVDECDFRAHGLVIAARSPALYEIVTAAANQDNHRVRVDEMKAVVFRSVLYFIYTDKLPSMDNLVIAAQDMLAAACRFGLHRMRIACENFLAEDISKDNVLNTLKLAQRHHCLKLKNYRLEFMSLPHVTKHVLKTIIGAWTN
ncbi:unnamed protein product [Alopecurus aequalis]